MVKGSLKKDNCSYINTACFISLLLSQICSCDLRRKSGFEIIYI